MRGIWFAVLTVLVVAVGLAALFEHRPGSRPIPMSAETRPPSPTVQSETASPLAGTSVTPAPAPADAVAKLAAGNTKPVATAAGVKSTEAPAVQSVPTGAPHAHDPAPAPAAQQP